jgi:hypothetical protein
MCQNGDGLCCNPDHRMHTIRRLACRLALGARSSRLRMAHAVHARGDYSNRPRGSSIQSASGVAALSGKPTGSLAGIDPRSSQNRTQRPFGRCVCRGTSSAVSERRTNSSEAAVDGGSLCSGISTRYARPLRVVLFLPPGKLRRYFAAGRHAHGLRIHTTRRKQCPVLVE